MDQPSIVSRRIVLAAVAAACLAGCAHSPLSSQWPVPRPEFARSFNPLDPAIPASARMAAIDAALTPLVAAAGDEAVEAGARDWGSGDAVTSGGLLAMVGGLAEKIGLVHSGAAIALIGGTGRARFQYAIQRQAYRKAEAALACVQNQVRLFNDDSRVLVLSAGNADEKVGATRAPLLAIEAVNRARGKLSADLEAIGAAAPTREALQALVDAAKKAEDKPMATTSAEANKAVAAVKRASTERLNAQGTLSQALKSADGASAPAASPQLRAWVASGLIKDGKPMQAVDPEPPPETWSVDDARNIAKAYPAELAKCVL